jgi:hypothetical protein
MGFAMAHLSLLGLAGTAAAGRSLRLLLDCAFKVLL